MGIRNFYFQLLILFFLSISFSTYSQKIVEEEIVIKLKKEVIENTIGLLNQEQVNARLFALGIEKVRKIAHKRASFSNQKTNRKL